MVLSPRMSSQLRLLLLAQPPFNKSQRQGRHTEEGASRHRSRMCT